jgi:acyl-CoA thioester hydrolase
MVAMTANDSWPDLAGRITDYGHVLPVRVYFEDTDFSQMVYHASYLRFMERGRSDFMRLVGVGHEALVRGAYGGEAVAFAVRRMTLDFLRPARIDDQLTVETRVAKVGGASLTLAQAVRRGDETLVTGEVVVVLVTLAGQPRRLPRDLREAMRLPPE